MNPNTGDFHQQLRQLEEFIGDNRQKEEEARAELDQTPDFPPNWPVYQVGQKLMVEGRLFKVRKITKKDLILRPVKEKK